MPTVTILDDYQRVATTSADWSAVAAQFDIRTVQEPIRDTDDLISRLGDCEVVVAMRERTAFTREVLQALPNLRLLVTTGMRNAAIDLDAAHDLGVTVCGTRGLESAVPELTIGMMIALMRGLAVEDANMRAGGWQHTIGPGLAGRTLGIVGLGRLGTKVVPLAHAFGMDVIAWSPNLTQERADPHGVRAVAKHTLFAESDVVTIHLPLTDSTRGIVGATELSTMRPTAYLVNTSRGPLVDEPSLIAALQADAIAGAALDVYDSEPLPVDHPLRAQPNTLLLPHIGYVTTDTYAIFYGDAVEDILAWADGAPIRQI